MTFSNAIGRARLALLFVSHHQQDKVLPRAPPHPRGRTPSYNSTITTRSNMAGTSSGIPSTAFPTFSHEAGFNFTWGFRHDFDLTVIVPICDHFDSPGDTHSRGNRSRRCHGAGE